MQGLTAVFIVTMALIVQMAYNPYDNDSLNKLEGFGLFSGAMTLYLGLWTFEEDSESKTLIAIFATVLIFAVNISWGLLVLSVGFEKGINDVKRKCKFCTKKRSVRRPESVHASGEVDMRRKVESEPGESEMSIRPRKSTATLNPLMSKESNSTSKSHKERENSVATRVKMDSRSTGSRANGFRSKTPISSKTYASKRKKARKKRQIAAPYHSSMSRTITKNVPNVTSGRTQYFANTTIRRGEAWETPTDESQSRNRFPPASTTSYEAQSFYMPSGGVKHETFAVKMQDRELPPPPFEELPPPPFEELVPPPPSEELPPPPFEELPPPPLLM